MVNQYFNIIWKFTFSTPILVAKKFILFVLIIKIIYLNSLKYDRNKQKV